MGCVACNARTILINMPWAFFENTGRWTLNAEPINNDFIQEPGRKYFDHLNPISGKANDLASEI